MEELAIGRLYTASARHCLACADTIDSRAFRVNILQTQEWPDSQV